MSTLLHFTLCRLIYFFPRYYCLANPTVFYLPPLYCQLHCILFTSTLLSTPLYFTYLHSTVNPTVFYLPPLCCQLHCILLTSTLLSTPLHFIYLHSTAVSHVHSHTYLFAVEPEESDDKYTPSP